MLLDVLIMFAIVQARIRRTPLSVLTTLAFASMC
jgi:hypothetical protein